jgi:hypothetical protein
MSAAEKSCCEQMAGQCDMHMAAKHPCCRKIVHRHDKAEQKSLAHFASSTLSLPVMMPERDLATDAPDLLFRGLQQFDHPPHDRPTPSIEILRI